MRGYAMIFDWDPVQREVRFGVGRVCTPAHSLTNLYRGSLAGDFPDRTILLAYPQPRVN